MASVSPASRAGTFPAVILTSLILTCLIHVTSASHGHHHHRGGHRNGRRMKTEGHHHDSRQRDSELADTVTCPVDHYLDEFAGTCNPCSACPVNQIIRRPCGLSHDTLCGPFHEFDRFQQHTVKTKTHQGQEKYHMNGLEDEGNTDVELSGLRSMEVHEAGAQWRTLSYALMVVLGVLCAVLAVVGFYVCLACRRSAQQAQKRVLWEPELLMPYNALVPEPRYVDTFGTSRQCPMTSRHLPVYQHVYTGSHVTKPSASRDVQKLRSSTAGRDMDQYIYWNCPSTNPAFSV